MTQRCGAVLAAMATVAALGGCAHQATQQNAQQFDAAVVATRDGTATLTCGNGLECQARWHDVQNTVQQDAVGQQWRNVAALVVGTGYDADISWFYLGQAAQGMGAYDAARQYFGTAIRYASAGGAGACTGGLIDLCNGVALPNDATMMLSQVPSGEPVAEHRVVTQRRSAARKTPTPAPQSGGGFVPPVATPAGGGPAFVPPVEGSPQAAPAPATPSSSFVSPVQ